MELRKSQGSDVCKPEVNDAFKTVLKKMLRGRPSNVFLRFCRR